MRVFKDLKRDHQTLLNMMTFLAQTTEKSSLVRPHLLKELREFLFLHSRVEEASVYRCLIDDDEEFDHALEAIDDHREMENFLERLQDLEPCGEGFMSEFLKFQKLLERHIIEEEEVLFPKVCEVLSVDELEEMTELFFELKSEPFEHVRSSF